MAMMDKICENDIPFEASLVLPSNFAANIMTMAALGAAAGIMHDSKSSPRIPQPLKIARQMSGTAKRRNAMDINIFPSPFWNLSGTVAR